jgi:hypothetical protein
LILTHGKFIPSSEYAALLPWRRVVNPQPVREYTGGLLVADHHDLLECGHTVTHRMSERKPATKRRCYMCGPQS